MKRIDPHVHCRDGKEAYKANIREVSELAKGQGISAILDMAEVFTEEQAKERIALAKKRQPVIPYFFYLRLTSQEKQIREAAKVAGDFHQVCGLKLFSPENEKRKIFRILTEEEYCGVLAIHPEKASLFEPELFDFRKPWTHNSAQPLEAEMASIEESIRFAAETYFPGVLYICHITSFASAEMIWQAKKYLDIYSEVTPHHLLLHTGLMERRSGLLLKVNPPLRDYQTVRGLLEAVKNGMVDCMGTDYAPHLLAEKLWPPHLSGIAVYELYGQALDFLRSRGLTEKEIENLTYWNIKKVFGKKLGGV